MSAVEEGGKAFSIKYFSLMAEKQGELTCLCPKCCTTAAEERQSASGMLERGKARQT